MLAAAAFLQRRLRLVGRLCWINKHLLDKTLGYNGGSGRVKVTKAIKAGMVHPGDKAAAEKWRADDRAFDLRFKRSPTGPPKQPSLPSHLEPDYHLLPHSLRFSRENAALALPSEWKKLATCV